MFKGGISQMMKKAQKMQEDMAKTQELLAKTYVIGESGGGLVKIEISCRHVIKSVNIDPSLMNDDKEMLEDLIGAAFNDALSKIEKTTQDKMSDVTGGLELPAGMKFPGF